MTFFDLAGIDLYQMSNYTCLNRLPILNMARYDSSVDMKIGKDLRTVVVRDSFS